MILHSGLYIATDTETGGLNPEYDALLSVAMIVFDNKFQEIDRKYIHLLPESGKIISEGAVVINGYSPEKWQEHHAVPLRDGMIKLSEWLTEFKNCKPLHLAHNAIFDQSFLNVAQIDSQIHLNIHPEWICTKGSLQLLRTWTNNPGPCRLDNICEFLNYQRSEFHDACEDALICGLGYKWILEQFVEKAGSMACPLGKYRGQLIDIIYQKDRQYLKWLNEQPWLSGIIKFALSLYLDKKENRDGLPRVSA